MIYQKSTKPYHNDSLEDEYLKQKNITVKKLLNENYTKNQWARKVIWYGHRNGAYFTNNESIEKDIAGHY